VSDTVVVALLSLLGTLAGSYFASRKSTALIAYRLEQLEEKVKLHNNLVERMTAVEEKIKGNVHRIEEIEHNV